MLSRFREPVHVDRACHRLCRADLLHAVVNFLVIRLNLRLPASVRFPAISAGGVVLNRILSQLLFREKFDWKQNLGFLAGVLAVVLLNL